MSDLIAALDNALAQVGQDIVLRRVVGTAPNQAVIDVTCRATVNTRAATQVVAGILAKEYDIIISPTQINQAQWPGGTIPPIPPFNVDQSIPRAGVTDKVRIANGDPIAIIFVDTIIINNEVVRHNMRALG